MKTKGKQVCTGLLRLLFYLLAELAPPPKGGVVGLCKIGCNDGTHEVFRLVSLIAEHLSESMREMHRKGG